MARQRRHIRESIAASEAKSKEHRKVRSVPRLSSSPKSLFGKWTNKMALFISFNVIILMFSVIYFVYQYYLENIVVTPLSVPKVVTRTGLEVPSMYWGTYRPGSYFSMQTRHPLSLVTGLMWFSQKITKNGIDVRHWCEQWTTVKNYTWLMHDGETFGIQVINDTNFVLTTSFVKVPGGKYGGDFTAKFSVIPKPNSEMVPVSLLFYTVAPTGSIIHPFVSDDAQLTAIHGQTESLGNFKLRFVSDKPGSVVFKYNYLRTLVPEGGAHLREAVLRNLALFQSKEKWQILGLIGHSSPQGSMSGRGNEFLVHQVTFLPPFEMEVLFESESVPNRTEPFTGELYDLQLQKHMKSFRSKFERVFRLNTKSYGEEDIRAAEAAASNMIGGIGYFYGSSLVQSSQSKNPVLYWEAPLYTAVPSRSFFPRGFLWDEGFHNLLILHWNPQITMDIMGHWLDLMNIEGWIPREQILGAEARERVPKEFVVQKSTNANPPTFFLTLESLLRRIRKGDVPDDVGFFKLALPRLRTWFQWFNRTQTGLLPGTYRWRGRDALTDKELNPKTLSSGLDDYPRASHPTEEERHVDLHCWIAYASKVLADIAEHVGEPHESFLSTYAFLSNNELLDRYYWSPVHEAYSDYGLHSVSVKLVKQQQKTPPGSLEPPKTVTVRVANQPPALRYVGNFGYVGLFPFLLQLIDPGNSKLGKVLSDLRDPNLLWTPYGLRSLSRTSQYYMKHNTENDPPYWRGPIWINMNYLAVKALYHYAQAKGPYQSQAQQLYKELRENVVNNILREYNRTGYIWEQYSDKTGQGQGSHPFTGWSALFVLMMAELY